jgi:hypothetical protein
VSAAEQPPETEHRPPHNRRVIHATCTKHGGGAGFTNLVVSKRDGSIELDPHVTGQCVLTLAEDEAIALRDALTEWLG